MTFTVALMIAVSYWGARDVQTPCHPQPVRISYQQMAAYGAAGDDMPASIADLPVSDRYIEASMRADIPGCRVLIGPLGNALRWTDEPRGWDYCRDVVHDVGHLDGLKDVPYGVMRADGGGHVPWACTHVKAFLRKWRSEH